MLSAEKFLEEYTETEFLEMCRLAASQDTGGQWTDEKIDAIETVKTNARFTVRRLFDMYVAQRQRAQTAETHVRELE